MFGKKLSKLFNQHQKRLRILQKQKIKKIARDFQFWQKVCETNPDIFTLEQKTRLKEKLKWIPQVSR